MKYFESARLAAALACGVSSASVAYAQTTSEVTSRTGDARVENEIVVTARIKEESLADVPVTVTVFDEGALQRYGTENIQTLAAQVPNLVINQTGIGGGANVYLRGVGSSPVSGAFDQSVAFNIDGVVNNIGRLIQVGYLDMEAVEVLKGPQSLYFGKSTTAGVISIKTKDPTPDPEMILRAGYEFATQEPSALLIASGPLTDTLGARLVVGYSKAKQITHNTAPVLDPNLGDESLNGRLTLKWDPSETFEVTGKITLSRYKNDNPYFARQRICANPAIGSQPTAIPSPQSPAIVLQGASDDCRLNRTISALDVNTTLTSGMPRGDDGQPFTETDAVLASLQMRWNLTDALVLRAVTGYAEVDNLLLVAADQNAGTFVGLQRELKRSFSQELNLISDFSGPINFTGGVFFSDLKHVSDNYQAALNLALLLGPDPFTGNGYEWQKLHVTDGKTYSAFLSAFYDITDTIQLSGGVRYTKEDKRGRIDIPYLSPFISGGPPFNNVPAQVQGLRYKDDNLSPEVAVNWEISNDVSVFASYKEAYKSGGIDTSALPTNSLAQPIEILNDALTFGAERAKGFEVGLKTNILNRALALNLSVFNYRYKGLQTQQFDFTQFQFVTLNASLVQVRGLEADLSWQTPIEGLQLRGAFSIIDSEYKESFFNTFGQDLIGKMPVLSAKFAGSGGFTYGTEIGSGWEMNLSGDARYNSGYTVAEYLDPLRQNAFWLLDSALRVNSPDNRFEIALIGRNLTNKTYATFAIPVTGACANFNPANLGVNPAAVCSAPNPMSLDQGVFTSYGRQVSLQATVRF